MSVTPGYTDQEIIEYVHAYDCAPHGTKQHYLTEHGLTNDRMRRWRRIVYDGNIDKGLDPRNTKGMNTSNPKRRSTAELESKRAQRIAELEGRITELEDANTVLRNSNEALGKAIGLLHETGVPSSANSPTPPPPADS